MRYDYHGLKTEAGDFKTAGDENEVNLMYSLGRNAALFAGWARINNDFDGSVARGTYGIDSSDSVVNNVAQFGAIVKADLAKNLALYEALWERRRLLCGKRVLVLLYCWGWI